MLHERLAGVLLGEWVEGEQVVVLLGLVCAEVDVVVSGVFVSHAAAESRLQHARALLLVPLLARLLLVQIEIAAAAAGALFVRWLVAEAAERVVEYIIGNCTGLRGLVASTRLYIRVVGVQGTGVRDS